MEKKSPTDAHECFLSLFGDQTVDVSTGRQWAVRFSSGDSDRGAAPPLVQIFMSIACRLLFIAGEKASLMVVTMLKNSVLYL